MFNTVQNMNKYLYSKVATDDAEILINGMLIYFRSSLLKFEILISIFFLIDNETYCPSQSYCDKFLNYFPELVSIKHSFKLIF